MEKNLTRRTNTPFHTLLTAATLYVNVGQLYIIYSNKLIIIIIITILYHPRSPQGFP